MLLYFNNVHNILIWDKAHFQNVVYKIYVFIQASMS